MNKNLSRMMKIALLAAMSVVLMYFEIPMTPFPWLKIDFSDVPALMGGFAFGPLAATIIVVLKNVLHVLVKGSETALVGQLGNILIGLSLVLPPAFIYRRNKTKKTAIFGMVVGFFTIQLGGIIANRFILIPLFGGTAILEGFVPAVQDLVNNIAGVFNSNGSTIQLTGSGFLYYTLFGLIPINSVKSIIVSTITYVLYKKVSVAIFKVEPMRSSKKKEQVA